MFVRQVSPGQTWYLIPNLVSVCLPFIDNSNSCHYDIMLVPIYTSGKDTLDRGGGVVGHINLV